MRFSLEKGNICKIRKILQIIYRDNLLVLSFCILHLVNIHHIAINDPLNETVLLLLPLTSSPAPYYIPLVMHLTEMKFGFIIAYVNRCKYICLQF